MKIENISRKLFIILILLLVISISLLLLLGESRKGLFVGTLYALLFLPIEVYATVFFLNNLLDKREDILEEARQDSYYFSIADQSQKQLIYTLKKGLVETFLVDRTGDVDEEFEYLYINRESILTEDFWKTALVYKYDIVHDQVLQTKKTVPLDVATEIGKYITEEILDFYSIYLKFIPLDIFKELHGIYQILEISILFSDNPYIMKQRYELVLKQSKKFLTDEECLELSEISKNIVEQIYINIESIEAITDEHYKKMLNN